MSFDREAAFIAYSRSVTDLNGLVALPVPVPPMELQDAWAMVVAAAARRLPELTPEITHVGRVCVPVAIADGVDAMSSVTLVEADGGDPKIFVSYDGSPGAVLTLAHELGHAVNLLHPAARGGTCRITQETAAFLMELVVMEGLSDMASAMAEALQVAFRRDYRFYGRASALLLAETGLLPDPDRYETVYPLAMQAATCLHDGGMAQAVALFQGGLNAQDLASRVLEWQRERCAALPDTVPDFATTGFGFDARNGRQRYYAFIGVQALLDILQDDILTEIGIGRYFSFLSQLSRLGVSRFLFDAAGDLRGYVACAEKETEVRDLVGAAPRRICNPWGLGQAQLMTDGALDLPLVRVGYGVGACLSLLAESPYHRNLQVGSYIRRHLMPAMANDQFRMWQEAGHPTGYVTCPSSYKMGHQSGLSNGGSGSFV